MDLSKIDLAAAADKGITVDLLHPVTGDSLEDDDGKAVSIKVLGKDSKKWVMALRKMESRNAQNLKANSARDTEARLLEALAECTLSWHNIDYDGKKLPCNKENALMLYKTRGWITEQIIEAASDRGLYYQK